MAAKPVQGPGEGFLGEGSVHTSFFSRWQGMLGWLAS